MTVEEFSNGFDTLVDSYRRFKGFDDRMNLDSIEYTEYEKSLYLTKALELIVLELYSGKILGMSFEQSEEIRRQLDTLIKLDSPAPYSSSSVLKDKFTHLVYLLPPDCWYIVYEEGMFGSSAGECLKGNTLDIVPVKHDEYQRTIKNPFRGPNSRKVLRLDIGQLKVELVSSYILDDYTIRYITKPEPIILTDLGTDNLSIDSKSTPQTCKLNSSIHQYILERAVLLALQHRITNTENNTNKSTTSKK